MLSPDLAEGLIGQCHTAAEMVVRRLGLPQHFVDELSSDVAFYVVRRQRRDPGFDANDGFLSRVAQSRLMNLLKRRPKWEPLVSETPDNRANPLEILIRQEGTIERFGRLTERERQTIEAVADLGSYAAAAEFLDLSTTRVKDLVAKARRKLTEDA
jgi:DNA-directed RNA polymerase specialized sigma24 family protein